MTTATQDLTTAPISYRIDDTQITLSLAGPSAYRVEVAEVSGGVALIEVRELSRSYETEDHARLVARQYAILFTAGWSIAEVAALTGNAAVLPADAIDDGIEREMGGGHGQRRNTARLARLTAAWDLLHPEEAARLRVLANRINADMAYTVPSSIAA